MFVEAHRGTVWLWRFFFDMDVVTTRILPPAVRILMGIVIPLQYGKCLAPCLLGYEAPKKLDC